MSEDNPLPDQLQGLLEMHVNTLVNYEVPVARKDEEDVIYSHLFAEVKEALRKAADQLFKLTL